MSRDKIVDLDELAAITGEYARRGKRVVMCHGVFDLLHIGHIRHFQQARRLGDVLVVTVTPDRYVNKGPGRPAFNEQLRMEAVASLDVVDHVALNRWPTAVETIRLLKPRFYVKGREYEDAQADITGGIALEREAVESVGGSLEFTDDIVFSSSSLINQHALVLPKEVSEYLADLRRRHPTAEILSYLERAASLRVLVMGETIIDEYQFCEAIGKSSKEPTLAVKELKSNKYAGGILAVANHVAGFVKEVGMLTFLGDSDTQEDFIRRNLHPNVKPMFLYRRNSPTIVKRRIIEHYFFLKMLEVYTINDAELEEEDNRALCSQIEKVLGDYDLVIVVDFGHSMMTPQAVKLVTTGARFLAVNAQANAGNMGYNVISKYPRADYVTLAEKEMRLEARDHRGDLRGMMERAAAKLDCPRMVVTRGRYGSLCYDRREGFFLIPVLAHQVVDRVGAGDAFLAISSLCAVQGAPMEVIGFVGNAVGAWAVSTMGNERAIDRVSLSKQIEALLK